MIDLLSHFDPIQLSEMDDVSLLKRTDTKYILPASKLSKVLDKCVGEYKILEINGQRMMNYRTLYFDTPLFKFYNDHQRGVPKRRKIRIREYIDSELLFLEIKNKNGKGVTSKKRLPILNYESFETPAAQNFLVNETGETYQLEKTLWNQFQRFTMVSKTANERVTVDLNLTFYHKNKNHDMGRLAIIELKKEKYHLNSIMAHSLKAEGIRPSGFSKYCVGISLMYTNLKSNLIKSKMLTINKINA